MTNSIFPKFNVDVPMPKGTKEPLDCLCGKLEDIQPETDNGEITCPSCGVSLDELLASTRK